ncbi:hypothetical protein R1sor_003991 [Riccia sorocarpa]|uniref:F-box domain-containing protein n=1 Tax=Riccia sorocarpa TaxID=122646 RepID=A0ABD3H9B9_9MARC
MEGSWASLMNELLADVFVRLPFEERLTTIPLVCKGWKRATHEPACWRNVDMEPWLRAKCERTYDWEFGCSKELEPVVKLVVDRSKGQLRQLRTIFCSSKSVQYIAKNCPLLTNLTHEFCGLELPDGDQEATAIGSYMQGLKHLELKKTISLTDFGLMHIASGCRDLESLNLACCSNVSPRALEKVSSMCPKLTKFMKPIHPRITVDQKLLWLLFD